MKIFFAIFLLIIAGSSVTALISGESFLGLSSFGELPLGNVLAALALVAPAGFAVLLSAPQSAIRKATLTALLAGLAWLPASIVLAGNLALNFSDWRGTVWIGFSVVVGLAVLCSLVWSMSHKLAHLRRRLRAA